VLLRLVLPPFLFLGLMASHPLAAQAVFQPADKPLFLPSLIQTADDALAGITVASLPGIPFTADVDVENRTLSPKGTVLIHRLTGKIARDSSGSLRTVVDLNVLGNPYDPTQVTIHIYDAPRKAEITLFPAASFAYRSFEDEEPRIALHPRPRLKQIPFEHLAGAAPEFPHSESEDLGADFLNGQPLRHGRQTTSVPAAFARDKKPFTTVMDYWYAQDLQAFVLIRRLGPNHSVQTVTLRNIRRRNPPGSLFLIPEDYRVETQHADNSFTQGYCPLP
jgi:hypothetical protein